MTIQRAQGDVLFTRVCDAPASKKLRKLATPIKVLEGESSGHIHNLHGQAAFYRATELGLDLGTVDVGKAGATVKHEKRGKATGDHNEIKLPPGRYKATRQREFRAEREEFVED